MRVKALYDFSGEPNTSELSINSGEVLTVTRTDVGEGWWEGCNSMGKTGLFPAAYVEQVPDASISSTSNVAQYQTQAQAPRYDQATDDAWNVPDDSDDEWPDEFDTDNYAEIGPPSTGVQGNQNQFNHSVSQRSGYESGNLPPPPADDTISIASSNMPIKSKSKIFSKSGDSYILGTLTPQVPENEKVYIVQRDKEYFWHRTSEEYTVSVRSPKKETKFKGMKSFIAYQLCPSFNGIAVSIILLNIIYIYYSSLTIL